MMDRDRIASDLAKHAAEQGLATIIRIAEAAPDEATQMTVIVGALMQIEAKSIAMRRGLPGITDEARAKLESEIAKAVEAEIPVLVEAVS